MGKSIPSWLTPGRIYVRNHVRSSKHEPVVVEAELIESNPEYAFIRLDSGHETTVSLRDVAPCQRDSPEVKERSNCHGCDVTVSFRELVIT